MATKLSPGVPAWAPRRPCGLRLPDQHCFELRVNVAGVTGATDAGTGFLAVNSVSHGHFGERQHTTIMISLSSQVLTSGDLRIANVTTPDPTRWSIALTECNWAVRRPQRSSLRLLVDDRLRRPGRIDRGEANERLVRRAGAPW